MVGMFELFLGTSILIYNLNETAKANISRSKKPPEPHWVISIKAEFENAVLDKNIGKQGTKPSIYRVPKRLREGNVKSYIPQIVSIGPYHHGQERLSEMEHHKWRAIYHMLKRTKQDLTLYLDAIKKVEKKARVCYEGNIERSHEFIKMMVLDGCFVLELLQGTTKGFEKLGYPPNDHIFSTRSIMYFIQRDLIMLENQLPLFILDLLFGLQIDQPEQRGRVAKLALKFFNSLILSTEPFLKRIFTRKKIQASFDPLVKELHFIDVYRRSLKFEPPPPKHLIENLLNAMPRQQLIYSVTELMEAGIDFKMRETDRFWDIKFKHGKLHIPRLLVHHSTKSLLLNLIAFEQCHPGCSNDITAYVIFMDNLINSPEDIKHLHYCRIIEHCLGSDKEVAELFNSLCKEVVFDFNDSYLSDISNQITLHCDNYYNTCCATLKHNYF